MTTSLDSFESFYEDAEPRLRVALVGAFGPELGRDATMQALAWAWGNFERVRVMTNPYGYLYRVGRNRALDELGRQRRTFIEAVEGAIEIPLPYPELLTFLAELSEQQRVSVWMVHGLGYSLSEVAEVLECSKSTVATHVRRALSRLRTALEVDVDV